MTAPGPSGETRSGRLSNAVHSGKALSAVLLLTCLCGRSAAVAPADPHLEPAETREFVELEKLWNEAHLKGDAAALERLWSPDLQIIAPKMPVMTHAEAVSFARSGRMKFERYATSNLNIRRYGDFVIVSGQMERRRKNADDKMVDDHWYFTKVYSHASGAWKVVIFQATEAPVR